MRFLNVFLSLATLSLPVWAVNLADPFGAEAMAPLRPSPHLSARVGEAPCATVLPAGPLAAIDAVDLALCNHPQTREVWAAARVQAALVGAARGAWLPTLDATASTTRLAYENNPTTRNTANLGFSWLLLDFGRRSASLDNARQLLNAATATQDATVQALFLAALQAYYSAQASQAAVVAAQEAERSANESFRAADARYAVGVATPADRLQAQTALSQATLNRIRAEGEARNALGTLANALGLGAQQALVLAAQPADAVDASFQGDVDALIAEALAKRPDLRAAEAQVKAAEAAADLARSQGRPSVSVSGGPTWQHVSGTTTQGNTLGLNLNVPLFAGYDTTYRVRSAQAQTEVRAAQRDRIRNQIALDVWKAYQSLTTATQSLKTTADLVASAEQSARVSLGRYKAGVGTILDVLSAQTALAAARQQRIQAQLDWQVYRATLAQAMGALDYTLLQGAAEDRP